MSTTERDEFVKLCTQMIRDLTPEGDMNMLLTEYYRKSQKRDRKGRFTKA